MSNPQEGDTVRVKVRSEPGSERVVHKFEGEVARVTDDPEIDSVQYVIDVPFGILNKITIKGYQAEFEVIE